MASDDSDSNERKDMSREESERRKRRIERKWLEEQKFYRKHEERKQRIIEKYNREKRQIEEGLLALTRSIVDTFRESDLDVPSSDFSNRHPILSAMNHARTKLRFEKGRESAGPSHSYESSRQVSSTSRRIESRRPRTPTPPYARSHVSRRDRSYDIDSKRRDHRQETSPSSHRRYSRIDGRSRSGSRSRRSHRDSPPRRTSSTRIEEARHSRPTETKYRRSSRDKNAADHERKSRRSQHSSAHYLSPERPSTSRRHDSESPGPSRRDPEYRRPRSRDRSRYRDPEPRPPTRTGDSRRETEHRRHSSSDRFQLVPSRPPFRDSVAYYEAAGGVPYQGYYAPAGVPGPPPPFMMPVGQVGPYIFPPGWQRPPFVPFPPHGFQPRPFIGQPPYPRWPNPGNYTDDPYHHGQGNRSWRKINQPFRNRNQSKKTTTPSSTITSSQAANPNPPVPEPSTSAAEMNPTTTTTKPADPRSSPES